MILFLKSTQALRQEERTDGYIQRTSCKSNAANEHHSSRTMTGISRSTMSQYYSGAFRPKEDKLRRIAKALEVNEAWLLGYENPNSTAELVEKFPNIRPVHLKQFPILGEIACGKPIFAEEERGSFLMASDEIHADFCLLAHGDSMTGARIYDGDAVFIRSQPRSPQ